MIPSSLPLPPPQPNDSSALLWTPHHDKEVTDVVWNRHDTNLAASTGGKTVCGWNIAADRLTPICQLASNSGSMLQCIFDPKPSKRLVAVSTGSLRMWDVNGNLLSVIAETSPADGGFLYAAWHPHGNVIAAVSDNNNISLYDIRKTGLLQTHNFPPYLNEIQWVDATTFAIAGSGGRQGLGEVAFFAMSDFHHPTRSVHAHTQSCNALQFWSSSSSTDTTTPRPDVFATGSDDSLVTVWDTKRLLCRGTIDRFENPIGHVQFSNDGFLLATIDRSSSERDPKRRDGARSERWIDIADVDTLRQVSTIRSVGDIECGCFHPGHRGFFLMGVNNRQQMGMAEIGLYKIGGVD